MIKRILHLDRSNQPTVRPRPEIIPRWVETADERCPLACVWFALPETLADQDDDPGSIQQPAFSQFFLKAGCLRYIHILPAPSLPLPQILI